MTEDRAALVGVQKFVSTSSHGGMVAVASNDYAGTYVRYEDHAAQLAAKEAEIAKLQALRKHHRARHKSYKRRHAEAEQRAEAALGLLRECQQELIDWVEASDGNPASEALVARIDALTEAAP